MKDLMPARINRQTGKEYILFWDEKPGCGGTYTHIQLAAFNGAAVCEDDERYEDIIKILEKPE